MLTPEKEILIETKQYIEEVIIQHKFNVLLNNYYLNCEMEYGSHEKKTHFPLDHFLFESPSSVVFLIDLCSSTKPYFHYFKQIIHFLCSEDQLILKVLCYNNTIKSKIFDVTLNTINDCMNTIEQLYSSCNESSFSEVIKDIQQIQWKQNYNRYIFHIPFYNENIDHEVITSIISSLNNDNIIYYVTDIYCEYLQQLYGFLKQAIIMKLPFKVIDLNTKQKIQHQNIQNNQFHQKRVIMNGFILTINNNYYMTNTYVNYDSHPVYFQIERSTLILNTNPINSGGLRVLYNGTIQGKDVIVKDYFSLKHRRIEAYIDQLELQTTASLLSNAFNKSSKRRMKTIRYLPIKLFIEIPKGHEWNSKCFVSSSELRKEFRLHRVVQIEDKLDLTTTKYHKFNTNDGKERFPMIQINKQL
ncbi:hypothetical protein QTN25_000814 [Entamoeba marina]